MQKAMASQGYQEIKNSGNFVKLFAFTLVNTNAKEMLNNDLSAGVISTTWKYGNINQLLKSISSDGNFDDAKLSQAAADIAEVIKDNSNVVDDVRKIAKKNKSNQASLVKYLCEKLNL